MDDVGQQPGGPTPDTRSIADILNDPHGGEADLELPPRTVEPRRQLPGIDEPTDRDVK